MPEYLCPGVYVEEMDAGAKRISASPTPIDDGAFENLAVELRRVLETCVPGWTDPNESDPGVTILEVFAFLSESLIYRGNQIPERGRGAALRAAAALAALGSASEPGCEGLKRPLFFSGRLLDAATLTAEQDYHREKLRRHNRALLGYGVVSGLGVRVETNDSAGNQVVVAPGYAVDPRGEEISLGCAATLAVPAHGDSAFVTLRYWERVCASGELSVEEACVIGIHMDVLPPAFPLARLVRSDSGWQVDPAFSPSRASRG